MTQREFLQRVIATATETEMVDKATELLNALDEKNSKRASKVATAKAEENAPLLAKLKEYMVGRNIVIASECSTMLGVSTSKASALLRKLVAEELATVKDVKITGKGTVKAYTLIKE